MTPFAVVEGPEDAPPLVLGSSLGTTHEMWAPQVAPLAEQFRLGRYDRRGHGRSPVVAGPASIDDLGRDLVGLLDELGLERVSFCGLSLGGLEGMWLGLEAPERIVRLVLCCTGASFPPRETWVERAATVRADGVGAIADAVLGRWFTGGFHDTRPDVVTRFREMLVATPPEGYAACCDALRDADLTPRLGAISAPTLVLTGAEDPSVPPDRGDALAAALPNAIHTVVEGAAHLANVEQPDAVTEALLRHLDQVSV
jgi:3-oxoadipate enol-lactonase